ncbi:MAG: GTP-binding protein [Rhodospirillales bacterium]|nr:GTP-binding protein [Rhodospirillales bacterium]
MDKIWVTLITGFLGSGKTTLLNTLLEHPAMSQAAIIVNEFGEIGLDYDLVERSDENVIQLANGCLCCSVKSDLIDTFRDLYIQRNAGTIPFFDRVIIETTGIADPAPVLQIILTNPMVFNHFALDGVVTTVDTVNGISSLDRFPECIKQAAIADRLIISKIDLSESDKDISDLKNRLRLLNPAAKIIATTTKDANPSDLFGTGIFDPETKALDFDNWLNTDSYENQLPLEQIKPNSKEPDTEAMEYYKEHSHTPELPEHHHDPNINSFVIVKDKPISLKVLSMFLEGLTKEAGPDLLRVKGIINVLERPDQPAVIQGAQQIFHSIDWMEKWPSEDKRTRIVFITRNLNQDYIEETLSLIERVANRTIEAAVRTPQKSA